MSAKSLLWDAVVGVRDWEYVRHRYLEHPEHRYHLLLLWRRLGLRPRALCVLRGDGSQWELVDWVGSPHRIPELLPQALAAARGLGAEELRGWISEGHAGLFQSMGCEVRDPAIPVPTITWTPGPDAEALQGRWWLMSGDSDFH